MKICVEFLMGVVFDDLYFSMDVYVWQLAGLRLVDAFILRYVYAGSQMNGQVDCVLLNVYASPLQWNSMDIYRVQGRLIRIRRLLWIRHRLPLHVRLCQMHSKRRPLLVKY